MAYLNVRDKRIETKIAYVGPELAGKATNFQQLTTDSVRGRAGDLHETVQSGGPVVSLEWRPIGMERFNDCDLSVRLIAARGELTSERLDALFADVDGIVVVVDADPSAQDGNRRAMTLVRETAPRVPVIVQLNKSDLDDALSMSTVAATLPLEEWPVVSASAARGEGVVETLSMALREVLESLKAKRAQEVPSSNSERAHNPLLAALKQILRETVTEHMAPVDERLDKMAQKVEEMRSAGEARSKADREHVTAAMSVIKRSVDAIGGDLRGIATEVKKLDGLGSQMKKIDGVSAELNKLDKLDKLDVIGADIKKLDVVKSVEKLQAKVDALSNALEQVQTGISRDVREGISPRLARIDETVQLMHVDSADALQRADQRVAEVKAVLDELMEKLKQQKKGWFG